MISLSGAAASLQQSAPPMPTITFYSSGDGSPTNGTWQLYVAGSYVNSTPSAISLTSSGFEAEFSGLTVTSGNAYGAHGAWTAAARL